MGSLLNSVMGGGGGLDIGSLVTTAIGVAFPPAGIAMGVSNMLNQCVGDAVNSAVSQLVKGGGMPSFLQDPIRELVDSAMKQLKQDNDPECDEAAQESFGSDVRDLQDQLSQSIASQASQNCSDEEGNVGGGKGGKGGTSWLVALAKAMGQMSGRHAKQLQDLSAKLDAASLEKNNAKPGSKEAGEAADAFTKLQSEFQGESQAFSMMQNTFSNALKTIGEGLTTMGRKG